MNIHSIVVDDFLDDFDFVREFADGAEYAAHRSDVDDIEYPGICPLPQKICDSVKESLDFLMGPVSIRHAFLRASPKGVYVPNRAHNDRSMGQYSLMLYLNLPEDCQGGTNFLRHVDYGMERGPGNEYETALAKRDANDADKWVVTTTCPMATNRALIFSAELMHEAAPFGGFGEAKNSRLVLTAFFDLDEADES